MHFSHAFLDVFAYKLFITFIGEVTILREKRYLEKYGCLLIVIRRCN